MARQRRIEYPGALYHVLARGDRKEAIVYNDGDREAFLRTVGEMCERTGIRVHAFVLLNNHYHLVLETPEANLVEGMSWLQNTYTRRFNVYHGLWGHLFGGRYKSIVVDETPDYFRRVVDYVHLNPVRAGTVDLRSGLERYPWCSLAAYVHPATRNADWLEVERGLAAHGLADTAPDRRKYLASLEQRVQQEGDRLAGLIDPDAQPDVSLQTTIRRGWYFGSEAFKDRMVKLLDQAAKERHRPAVDPHGPQQRDYGTFHARRLINAGCDRFQISPAELRKLKANDPRKVLVAELIASTTSVRLDWIRGELGMGSRGYCCRLINAQRRQLQHDGKLRRERARVAESVKGDA